MPLLSWTLLLLFAGSVSAQTSLYIPNFDSQPISADILGVDSQGRTTWALHKGAPTDTFDDSGFVGTATLVEGPTDASLTYADPFGHFSIGLACSLSADLAVCSAVSGAETFTGTETISRIVVQAGTTASPSAPTSVSTSPSSPNPSQQSDPSRSIGASQTSQDTTPKPINTSNAWSLIPYLSTAFLSVMSVAMLI